MSASAGTFDVSPTDAILERLALSNLLTKVYSSDSDSSDGERGSQARGAQLTKIMEEIIADGREMSPELLAQLVANKQLKFQDAIEIADKEGISFGTVTGDLAYAKLSHEEVKAVQQELAQQQALQQSLGQQQQVELQSPTASAAHTEGEGKKNPSIFAEVAIGLGLMVAGTLPRAEAVPSPDTAPHQLEGDVGPMGNQQLTSAEKVDREVGGALVFVSVDAGATLRNELIQNEDAKSVGTPSETTNSAAPPSAVISPTQVVDAAPPPVSESPQDNTPSKPKNPAFDAMLAGVSLELAAGGMGGLGALASADLGSTTAALGNNAHMAEKLPVPKVITAAVMKDQAEGMQRVNNANT